MKLSEVEHTIGDADLFLVQGRRFHSRVIQFWTQSQWSHACMAMWIETGAGRFLTVMEAKEGSGVQPYPLKRLLKLGYRVDWFRVDDPGIDRGAMVHAALEEWGDQYASWWQLLRSFSLIGRRFADWMGWPTRVSGSGFFCSWFYMHKLLNYGKYRLDPDEELVPEQMSPGDLVRLPCLKYGGTLVGV